MKVSQEIIEEHRAVWAKLAKKNGWYTEPFYVQVWVDEYGEVIDSVSYKGITEDSIVVDEE